MKRINFFNLLDTGEDEWRAEQSYHRTRLLRHLAYAHAPGILTGFAVTQTSPASLDVVVHSGYGVDENGEPVWTDEPTTVSLAAFVPAEGTATVYVVAAHETRETDPVYVNELDESKASMIEDVTVIQAQTEAPGPGQLELCRVEVTAGATEIADAADVFAPQANEIDLTQASRAPAINDGGLLSDRPASPCLYERYFATDQGTGGLLLTWDGSNWRDAMGNTVA
jgi:hypothetical protein